MTNPGWLFPGQGAQHPGMGRDFAEAFPEAKRVFDAADSILDLPLSRWIWDDSSERVHQTDVAQPGIFVTSVAIATVLVERFGFAPPQEAAVVAGLSLGEYTALWAAGSLSFEDALRLVRWRGEFMQAASEARPSGMTSVMGVEPEVIQGACEEASSVGIVSIANRNAPGQIVISGENAAVARASELLKERGARRLIPLKVAGAFHSECMRPAADRLAEKLASTAVRAPRCRFLPNVSASSIDDPDAIRASLVEQICSSVLWEESMRTALDSGVRRFVEPGPGGVLKGLLRKIDPEAEVEGFPDVASLPKESP